MSLHFRPLLYPACSHSKLEHSLLQTLKERVCQTVITFGLHICHSVRPGVARAVPRLSYTRASFFEGSVLFICGWSNSAFVCSTDRSLLISIINSTNLTKIRPEVTKLVHNVLYRPPHRIYGLTFYRCFPRSVYANA